MESELVSGFMTEHSAGIFVFFFLAEYASIVLICILISILFIGGFNFALIISVVNDIFIFNNNTDYYNIVLQKVFFSLSEGGLYGFILGVKTCFMIFIFIWARASFPRIRFDQLMLFCWTVLLPIVIAFIILIPCITKSNELICHNISIF